MSDFKSAPVIDEMAKILHSDENLKKDLIAKSKSVIIFNLKNKTGTKGWKLDLKNKGELVEAEKADFDTADLVITLNDLDFKKLVNGKANSQRLFLSGKLKVKGDVMKAASIETILKKVAPEKAKF